MAIHKLKNQNKDFAFSECGKALHLIGGQATKFWEDTTCKNCLKHRRNRRRSSFNNSNT